jgi:hypothetical protein
MNLNGIPIPAGYNGIGLHDTPGDTAAAWDYPEAQAHAKLLLEHGVTTYKLLAAGSSKLQRARAYVEAGIVPVVRFYEHQPWGRGHFAWVTPYDQMKPYYDVGVRLFETAGNETNIASEWADGRIPTDPAAIAREAVGAWAAALVPQSRLPGSAVLLSSMTPGGNVDHRACYREIVKEIARRGLQSECRHIAVHIRSHNVPPAFRLADNPTMTISWDEHRWIVETFAAAGMRPYLWSTEFGPAPFDDPPSGFPRLPLDLWAEYAWDEFRRMDPAHPGAAHPQLAGVHHWFEAGWGHSGAWTKDSLRDSQDPRIPTPSPLWLRMAREASALHFQRYPEPAGPGDPGTGFRLVDLVGRLPLHVAHRYPSRPRERVTLAVLHYSWVTPPLPDDAHEIAQIRSIARGHIRAGWPGIGYHYIVGPSGTVYRVNALETISCHAGSQHNATTAGICCLLRDKPPTRTQVQATAALVRSLGLPVRPHRDLVRTACPGAHLWPAVKEALA